MPETHAPPFAAEELRLMRDLAILADDLTGALDTGAAFASPLAPVEARWTGFTGGRTAYDTETRGADVRTAERAVADRLPDLAESALALKKLDSLLRGNTFAELAACCRNCRFDAVYIAPAFPVQGRITLGGVQLRVTGASREPVAPPIAARLAAGGVDAIVVRHAGELPARGVAVCDAASEGELDDLVAAGRANGSRTLWCGSAGLAHALAGGPVTPVSHPVDLVILGSRHEVTKRHVAELARHLGPMLVRISDPVSVPSAVAATRAAIERCGRAALAFDMPPLPTVAAERCYAEAFARLRDALPPPAGLAVVGGDTVFRLMQALDADSLRIVGQRAPGLPVSHICGGAWGGVAVTSKSGAFDDAGLFGDFIRGDDDRA